MREFFYCKDLLSFDFLVTLFTIVLILSIKHLTFDQRVEALKNVFLDFEPDGDKLLFSFRAVLALFGDDLMSIDASENVFDYVWLIWNESEVVLNLIEEYRTELVNIHLDEYLDERFVIMGFYSFCEESWIESYFFRVLQIEKQFF